MSEDEKIIDNFKYWFETNTENGVSTIPDFICKKLLDLCQREKNSNQWLLKAFDESRNNNIELAKEYYKLQEELKQEKEENKDKIREKIKKLEKEQKEYKGSQEWEILDVINAQIDVLKELLEEE